MTVEIISRSISTKVWDRAEIELVTPGSAVRRAAVARHVTDCADRPGRLISVFLSNVMSYINDVIVVSGYTLYLNIILFTLLLFQ